MSSIEDLDDVGSSSVLPLPDTHTPAVSLPTTASMETSRPRKRGLTTDPTVSWDIISSFKMEKLLETFRERSPLTSHLLLRFMRPKERKRRKTTKGHYRPVENVSWWLIDV